MEKKIFEFKQYKPYIRQRLGGERKKTGLRAEASRAMNCQTAYLSQVLNGDANMSLERFSQSRPGRTGIFLAADSERASGHARIQIVHRRKTIGHERRATHN